MQIIAVIGDIIESKELARREAFQRKLAAALAAVGGPGSGLASPYTITLGDEFQAVYRSAGTVWRDVVDILAALHPVRVRFAIGVGELTTRLNPKQALGMDGPAFHRARAAMTELKDGPVRFRVAGAQEADWRLANHTLGLLSRHLDGWSRNRLQVLAGLLHGRPVREIEAALRISKVAVYKNINAAALDEVVAICQEIERALAGALHRA